MTSQKRQRVFESGERWTPLINRRNRGDLTFESVEQIFMKAFGLDKKPEWQNPTPGHYLTQGKLEDSDVFANFSFWPNTGSILFQGRKEEKRINEEKRNNARIALEERN